MRAENVLRVRVTGDSMWPTLADGATVMADESRVPEVGDLIVFRHPLKDETVIKRFTRREEDRLFVEGDNPDPTGSEDSHNFGSITAGAVIAVVVE